MEKNSFNENDDPTMSRKNVGNHIAGEGACRGLAVLLLGLLLWCLVLTGQNLGSQHGLCPRVGASITCQSSACTGCILSPFQTPFGLPVWHGAALGDDRTECWSLFVSSFLMHCENSWVGGINCYKLLVYAKRCLHTLLESPLELVEQCSHQH